MDTFHHLQHAMRNVYPCCVIYSVVLYPAQLIRDTYACAWIYK